MFYCMRVACTCMMLGRLPTIHGGQGVVYFCQDLQSSGSCIWRDWLLGLYGRIHSYQFQTQSCPDAYGSICALWRASTEKIISCLAFSLPNDLKHYLRNLQFAHPEQTPKHNSCLIFITVSSCLSSVSISHGLDCIQTFTTKIARW